MKTPLTLNPAFWPCGRGSRGAAFRPKGRTPESGVLRRLGAIRPETEPRASWATSSAVNWL